MADNLRKLLTDIACDLEAGDTVTDVCVQYCYGASDDRWSEGWAAGYWAGMRRVGIHGWPRDREEYEGGRQMTDIDIVDKSWEEYRKKIQEGADWLQLARVVAGMTEKPLVERVSLMRSITEWGAGYELGRSEERIREKLALGRYMRRHITDDGLPPKEAEVICLIARELDL